MSTSRKQRVRQRTGAKRIPVTIQLHPEKDKDIIEYLAKKENKQAAIKDAIRRAINNDTPDMQVWLKDMRGYLDQQFREIKHAIKSQPVTASNGDVPKDEALKPELRNAMIGAFKQGKRA